MSLQTDMVSSFHNTEVSFDGLSQCYLSGTRELVAVNNSLSI